MSSQQPGQTLADSELSDAEVEHYLTTHPEFFERHPRLLSRMRVPHDGGGGSVSLVERQLTVIRQKNTELERRLRELVEVARSNHELSDRVHELALRLIDSDGRDAVIRVLEQTLREDFGAADSVVVLFHGAADIAPQEASRFLRWVDRSSPALGPFATFLEQGRPRCGRARDSQLEFLFPEHAMTIGSIALVPLGEDAELGVLAIGSRDTDRFHPGMSTDYLERLGQLISAALAREHD
jgi:uncharacterized protein YigA (DUF484 family)